MEAASRGRELSPDHPLGPLVIGQCLEESGDFEGALDLYARFIQEHGDVAGVAAVEGRRVIALQMRAREVARSALEREEALGPADPETVGVLPFIVDAGPEYEALSVGLAHMLTTDLALLRRVPLVERVELNALLQELDIPAELIDPATAARAGRLMGASRMVLGTVSIPSEDYLRMGGNIVLETGELVEPLEAEGSLNRLLSLEKTLAIQTAENLGYVLSEAERQRILENRPESLAAFLAFANGLLAEERGDFQAAAAHFREAAQADPQYQQAQERLRGSVAAEALARASYGEMPAIPVSVDQSLGLLPVPDVMASVLGSSILDIASHQPERATIDAGTANTVIDLLPEDVDILPALEAIIIIMITIPG
jgi:tetratricopeptide (TPR) repeat protein